MDNKTENMIEYDHIEQRYIDMEGNLYKTIDDIPESMRHLVASIRVVRPYREQWTRMKIQKRHRLRGVVV